MPNGIKLEKIASKAGKKALRKLSKEAKAIRKAVIETAGTKTKNADRLPLQKAAADATPTITPAPKAKDKKTKSVKAAVTES